MNRGIQQSSREVSTHRVGSSKGGACDTVPDARLGKSGEGRLRQNRSENSFQLAENFSFLLAVIVG